MDLVSHRRKFRRPISATEAWAYFFFALAVLIYLTAQ